MYHEEIESLGFTGRLKGLRSIKRWKSFVPAFYRHDLEMHTLEILFILDDLAPLIKQALPNIDMEKARVLALVHDDPETVSKDGDVEFNKKLNMTADELEELEHDEEEAIEKLSNIWPKEDNGYNYHNILYEAKAKNTVESQLISFIDKFSALCESLHELHAGNKGFHKGWRTERARPPVRGTNINELIPKYNLIKPFFSIQHPIIPLYKKPDVGHLLETGKPYTPESVLQSSDLRHYDYWKSVIIKNGGSLAIKWLTEQREF